MSILNQSFTNASFDALGGRKMDTKLVKDILKDINSIKIHCKRQTIILILGSNNIRRNGDGSDIIPYFEKIVKSASKIGGCHIVICGIIPSLPDARSKKNFCSASYLLKDLCQKYPIVSSFCPLANYLTKDVKYSNPYTISFVSYSYFDMFLTLLQSFAVPSFNSIHIKKFPKL